MDGIRQQFEPPGISTTFPPPRKAGQEHSENILVYYRARPDLGLAESFSITYYAYDTPSRACGGWVDYACRDRIPDCWWPLPGVRDSGKLLEEKLKRQGLLIRQLLVSVPTRREWLDPVLEAELLAASRNTDA